MMIAFIVILLCAPVFTGIFFGKRVKEYNDTHPQKSREEMSLVIHERAEALQNFFIRGLTYPLRFFSRG